MTDTKEGVLQMQPSGRWAVCRPGRAPVEITSGELFRVEDEGALKVTREALVRHQHAGKEHEIDRALGIGKVGRGSWFVHHGK